MKVCPTCGSDVIVDFRAKRTFCGTCSRAPHHCTCQPVGARWLRQLKARDETGRVVAA
jgi:hypothetical protein